MFSFKFGRLVFRYDVRGNRLEEVKQASPKVLSKKPARLFGKYSPDSTYVAYVKRHDLYVMRVKDSVETRMTTDGERYYSYGRNDRDMGVQDTRAEWFGDSKKMYVIREDMRNVEE